jgi:hypothetical protein
VPLVYRTRRWPVPFPALRYVVNLPNVLRALCHKDSWLFNLPPPIKKLVQLFVLGGKAQDDGTEWEGSAVALNTVVVNP